jgi:hypothetical protein
VAHSQSVPHVSLGKVGEKGGRFLGDFNLSLGKVGEKGGRFLGDFHLSLGKVGEKCGRFLGDFEGTLQLQLLDYQFNKHKKSR